LWLVLVTPLNLLGKQNVKLLEEAGLPAIAISKETANQKAFKVSPVNPLYEYKTRVAFDI
jgi:hypothetical protein